MRALTMTVAVMVGLVGAGRLAAQVTAPAPAPERARRFTLAAGPALTLDEAPPSGGMHLRGAAALGSVPRPLNLMADAYASWLPWGSADLGDGSGLRYDANEFQWGIGLSGVVTLFPTRAVAPYLLVGGVQRWSHVRTRVPATGDDFRLHGGSADILLGLGTNIRQGRHLWNLEARLYGGSVYYMPVTVGLTF